MKHTFKIAHILYVTEIRERQRASYLHVAQPLTIKSMINAKKEAESIVDVDLVATTHEDDQIDVPDDFNWAARIKKYGWEYIDSLRDIEPHKELPRIADIINNLYEYSDADYFIYTNLDIGVRPNFYVEIAKLIEKGYDGFSINRRDLPKEYNGLLLDESQTQLIYTLDGDQHPGIDCVVFKRAFVPSMKMGNVFIGSSPIGQVLMSQIAKQSAKFEWFKDLILTFHIGQDSPWTSESEYYKANVAEGEGLYENWFAPKPTLMQKIKHKLRSILRLN
jgi:hypothetical protein